jgi:hypothetical protein
MNKNSFKLLAGILLIATLFTSCNKESYIENEGTISVVTSNPANNTGSVTFWTSNPSATICSNGLRITVDGSYKGALMDYSYSDVNCGANGSKALTLTLPVGSHSYTANGSGSFCPKYTGTVTIKKGGCITLELSK